MTNSKYPPIGSKWLAGPKSHHPGDTVQITGYDKWGDGRSAPGRVQFKRNGRGDSVPRNQFYQLYSLGSQVQHYPAIGSKWNWPMEGTTIEVTAHDINMNGKPESGRIQFRHASGKIDSVSYRDFHSYFEELARVSSSGTKHKKQNNDGRDTCYSCGHPTRAIGISPSSDIRICIKCGK